ncbi:hypothetical protein FGO68_gene11203 [Halteria grandinella]|uniref:Uncharacterized protein n=1 Tax=Halteria grandinella TaxID=5974 RepID=A0A8J8NVE4_HALGN|nr:hypothetical protein FGO68_gene11203 [Halteria grandinella]
MGLYCTIMNFIIPISLCTQAAFSKFYLFTSSLSVSSIFTNFLSNSRCFDNNSSLCLIMAFLWPGVQKESEQVEAGDWGRF